MRFAIVISVVLVVLAVGSCSSRPSPAKQAPLPGRIAEIRPTVLTLSQQEPESNFNQSRRRPDAPELQPAMDVATAAPKPSATNSNGAPDSQLPTPREPSGSWRGKRERYEEGDFVLDRVPLEAALTIL